MGLVGMMGTKHLLGVAVFLFIAVSSLPCPLLIAAVRAVGFLLHADLGGAVVDRQCRRLADLLYRPHQYRAGRLCADAGGYVSAILVVDHGVSFWLTIPLAGVFCAALSVLIGLPILRLRGVYFAMVTLVLTEVARLSALSLSVTKGAKGIVSIPLPGGISLFGLTIIPDFSTLANVKLAFYYLAVTMMVICFAGLYRLVNSRIGHLCRSLQQNEELASSIGVNIAYLRMIAYSISSFLGGIAGAIFVAISQSIYPSSFQVADSINFMLNCFLGGLGFVFGPMLGTLVLYFGWDLLFQTGRFQLLIYSSLLIAMMVLLPNGLLSIRLFNPGKSKS